MTTMRAAVIVASAAFLYLSDSQTSQIMVVASLVFGGIFLWLAQTKSRAQLAPAWVGWVLLAIPALLFVSMAIDKAAITVVLSLS